MSVSVRRAVPDDLGFLLELVNDEDVEPFLGGRAARDRESLRAEIDRSTAEPQEFGRFVIEVDGARAGAMGFEVANRRSRIAPDSRRAGRAALRALRRRGALPYAQRSCAARARESRRPRSTLLPVRLQAFQSIHAAFEKDEKDS